MWNRKEGPENEKTTQHQSPDPAKGHRRGSSRHHSGRNVAGEGGRQTAPQSVASQELGDGDQCQTVSAWLPYLPGSLPQGAQRAEHA